MINLSIILPVYNERDTLEEVLIEWKKELLKYKINYKFVICEDGSTDGTDKLIRTLTKKYPIILSQKRERRGYGKAVLDGINAAPSEFILCVDSDGQCDPKDFIKFWKKRNSTDILIGWRKNRADNPLRKIYSGFFKCLFVILFSNKIHDPSAPFVLFEKQTIIPHIKYFKYLQEGFWWGFTAACIKRGLSLSEIPVNHRLRMKGKTQVYKFTKIPSIASRNAISLFKLRFAN